MQRHLLAAAFFSLVVLLAGCGDRSAQQQQAADTAADRPLPDPLRVATEGAYPPFNFFSADGTLTGFDLDVMNEMCTRMKVRCEIVAQAWEGIIPGLQTGKYDAIIAGMSITEERRQAVDFTMGYATTPAYLVTLKDSPLQQLDVGMQRINLNEVDPAEQAAIDTLKTALAGKTVGVQTATIHAEFLEKYLGDTVAIRRYDTQDNLALDLASGRIDAGLADSTAWEAFLDSPQGQGAAFAGPGFDGGPFGLGIGIAVRKNEPKLVDALNGALASMKQDGTLTAMAEKWFGFDASMP